MLVALEPNRLQRVWDPEWWFNTLVSSHHLLSWLVLDFGLCGGSLCLCSMMEIGDFQYDEDSDTYYYPCPCGE